MSKIKSIFLLLVITAGVLSPFFVHSANLQVVINEVLYDPEGSDLDYEWIELFNPTGSSVNLAGWTIEAGGSSFDSVLDLPAEEPLILNSQSFYLIGEQNVSGADLNVDQLGFQNGGSATDGIRILDQNGQVVDTLLYDEPNANNLPDDSGNSGTSFAVDVSNGISLGRNDQSSDTDNSAADFQEYSDPTPGEVNQSPEPPQDYSRDIIINEFLPDPAGLDSDGEFIELKNIGSSSVDVADWIISDASQSTYVIDPTDFSSSSISAGGFFVIDRAISGIALNNSGEDQVELYQPDDTLLDEVVYSGSEEGESYARQKNGEFIWTTTPTPGTENVFSSPNQAPIADAGSNIQAATEEEIQFDGSDSFDPDEDPLTYSWDFGDGTTDSDIFPVHKFSSTGNYLVTLTVDDGLLTDSDSITVTIQENSVSVPPGGYSGSVVISEVFPNPEGSDNDGEFIELKNIGSNPVDLLGWQLGDSSSSRYSISSEDFSSTVMKAGSFLAIFREISGIALNNSGGDKAVLYYPDEKEVFSVEYSGSAPDGKSYCLLSSGEWVWTDAPSPGEENVYATNNEPPAAKIEAVAEARVGMEISFDASDSSDPNGDPLEYLWDFGDGNTAEGIEAQHAYQKMGSFSVTLTVSDPEGASTEAGTIIIISDYDYAQKVLLNELMINVSGEDSQGEWVELVNLEDREVNLIGWQIADLKDNYLFSEDTLLAAQEYLVVSRAESKITLNNSEDNIYLLNPKGEIVSGVSYPKAAEDFSFARKDFSEDWVWTSTPTPGSVNEINEALESEESEEGNDQSTKSNAKGKEIITAGIEKIKELEKGTLVQTEGWVTVEPGILASQRFYIMDKEKGIQIYSSKKDFPELSIGDYVQVTGKLSEASGEKKINISTAEDIQILEPQELIPEPIIITTEEIGEPLEGALITVEGNVVDKKGKIFFLEYGGPTEIKVSIKSTTDIEKLELEDGQLVQVTGIVSQSNDVYQILPRHQEDLVFPEVLGASGESNETSEISSASGKGQFLKYILILIGGVVVVGIGFLIKKYSLLEKIKQKFGSKNR